MELSFEGISGANTEKYDDLGIDLPLYSPERIKADSLANPRWLHLGLTDMFRGPIANIQDKLLNGGFDYTGIIALASDKAEAEKKLLDDCDYLCLYQERAKEKTRTKVVGSLVDFYSLADPEDLSAVEIFMSHYYLDIFSLTIGSENYELTEADKAADLEHTAGPLSQILALLYLRYKSQMALAIVSFDDLEHNGDKLKEALISLAKLWAKDSKVEAEFIDYLADESKFAFPNTKISKKILAKDEELRDDLAKYDIANLQNVEIDAGSKADNFVAASLDGQIIIEDKFPNGRPNFEAVDVSVLDSAEFEKLN